MAKILAVVASTQRLPSGAPSGYWLEELAAAYARFARAGLQVDIASPRGGPVAHDPASEGADFLTEDGRALLADAAAQAKLADTRPLAWINPADYAAIYLVGGVPAASDFDANADLNRLLAALLDAGKPVGAVCHGVIGLTSLRLKDGRLAAEGHPMTGFSHAEEVALSLLDEVAVVPETRLRAIGADYRLAEEPFGACVAEGALFVTGQNPASAGPAAEALVARLGAA